MYICTIWTFQLNRWILLAHSTFKENNKMLPITWKKSQLLQINKIKQKETLIQITVCNERYCPFKRNGQSLQMVLSKHGKIKVPLYIDQNLITKKKTYFASIDMSKDLWNMLMPYSSPFWFSFPSLFREKTYISNIISVEQLKWRKLTNVVYLWYRIDKTQFKCKITGYFTICM